MKEELLPLDWKEYPSSPSTASSSDSHSGANIPICHCSQDNMIMLNAAILRRRRRRSISDAQQLVFSWTKAGVQKRSQRRSTQQELLGSAAVFDSNVYSKSPPFRLRFHHMLSKKKPALSLWESLDSESNDGNHGRPRDATSCDSCRFCIAWFSNCYGNEHHRMQNRAILLQCDRPLKGIPRDVVLFAPKISYDF